MNFKDLGSKGKILSGRRGIFFQGFGEINALFSGIKGSLNTTLSWTVVVSIELYH